MSYMLDVSLLLACGWRSHPKHAAALTWLEGIREFATNPFSEVGFIRVSMSPGYRASFADATIALAGITGRKQARFLPAHLPGGKLPAITTHAEATDAYLVELARSHGLQLATLDDALCLKPWASGIAENPL